MKMNLINEVTKNQIRTDWPEFKAGDTIAVSTKITEGNKERIQVFKGLVLKIQNSDINKTFTVRKLSYNVSVEKTFPFNSPIITNIEVLEFGRVRRAKLYYMRSRTGKAARIKSIRISKADLAAKEAAKLAKKQGLKTDVINNVEKPIKAKIKE